MSDADTMKRRRENEKKITVCLHLAAFGCEQCKAIVKQEIEKERARCLRLISDRWNWGRDAVSKMIREPE